VILPEINYPRWDAAASVITLCTNQNPRNRARLWQFGDALHRALVAMGRNIITQEGVTWVAAAAAFETIESAIIESPENHDLFMKADVVGAVMHAMSLPCRGASYCHLAQMRAALVIEALTASYCFTETGDCEWEYDHNLKHVELEPHMTIKFDPEQVRLNIIHNRELLTHLIEMACSGPIDEEPDDELYPWPSRAKFNQGSAKVKTIKPWAAAAALRNLALSPAAHGAIAPAFKCLCDLTRSPDALEEVKGEETINRLGFQEGDCPRLYDERCMDLDGWRDSEGDDCQTYEVNRWCAEYGEKEDQRGVIADDACCACGGGSTKQQMLK